MDPITVGQNPAILSIAGSDPSGGAGIQADLKTFSALGIYGAAAITCLTAQNTMGVVSYLPVEPAFVKKQIDLVLEDIKPTHIKIGMVGNGAIAAAISRSLESFAGQIIYDPVLKSSSGHQLFEPDDIQALTNNILNKATVVTPNISELEILAKTACKDKKALMAAAQGLMKIFPNLRGVVVTGGHFDEHSTTISDFLFLKAQTGRITSKKAEHPRLVSKNTHGTGCTFSSALAAFHLLYGNYEKAFYGAVGLLEKLIGLGSETPIGHGHGPLPHHLYRHK